MYKKIIWFNTAWSATSFSRWSRKGSYYVIDRLPNLEGTASSEIRHFRSVTQTKAYRIKWLPFSTVDWSGGKIKFFMTTAKGHPLLGSTLFFPFPFQSFQRFSFFFSLETWKIDMSHYQLEEWMDNFPQFISFSFLIIHFNHNCS